MGIITPTDGWDSWKISKIKEQEKTIQEKIWEILTQEESEKYFKSKPHKFNVTEPKARSNSKMMDAIIKEINEENKDKKLTKLWKEISKQYKEIIWKDIELSNKQIQTIIETHKLEWELWKLTRKELKQKVKRLKKEINDEKTIRFLLEAGFCGFSIKNLFSKLNTSKKDLSIEQRENLSTYEEKLVFLKNIFDIKDEPDKEKIESLTSEKITILKNLKDLWIKIGNIFGYDILSWKKIIDVITFDAIEPLQKLKELWIDISNFSFCKMGTIYKKINIEYINKNIDKIAQLKKLWISINDNIMLDLDKITEHDLIEFKNLIESYKSELKWLWINPNTINNIDEIVVILQIIPDILKSKYRNIKEYINKKKLYLKKIRELEEKELKKNGNKSDKKLISDEEFNQLFKEWDDKWKYWIQNIYQRDLWYCYAYSWFELLKKSNFFDVLVKTSMKKTADGWEVNLPLWDLNWYTIKINKSEIDSKYTFIDKKTWKQRNDVNINSDSALWFKILEIGFIKEYIINNHEYDDIPAIEETRKKYQETWDIILNWELLNIIEWWETKDFFKYILGEEYVSTITLTDNSKKKAILKLANQWNIKIDLSNWTDCNSKDLEKLEISDHHVYSIERIYYDKKLKKDIVIFVNPRYTNKKYEITADECCKAFGKFGVTIIRLDKLFQ